jgi:DNA polymerase III subunit epsilon
MATATREIVLDTETTGLYARNGDKLIEIGCVELVNRIKTGRTFHRFINPLRTISIEATRVHGITDAHVKDKPSFDKIAYEFLEFISDDSKLIIHNARFDMEFINTELSLCNLPIIPEVRVTDTLNMVRKKFPGSPASLDALCKRFKISLETRDKHGALIDAELLTQVYLHLTGGPQSSMNLLHQEMEQINKTVIPVIKVKRPYRYFPINAEELAEHKKLLEKLNNPLWNNS